MQLEINRGDNKLSPNSGHIEKSPRRLGKRWKKGSMKGKGGPENAACEYRGVRQRTWGKWVAEIREPKKKARLWLGSFSTAKEAALAHDIAARKLYGPLAELNLPPHESEGLDSVPAPEFSPSSEEQQKQTPSASPTEDGSSSLHPQRVSSLPDFHQQQHFSHDGERHSMSAPDEFVMDIEHFLDRIDSEQQPPDDDDSSQDTSSFQADCRWEDEDLRSQLTNLDLQSIDSVFNEPLVPESVELWDTGDQHPPSDRGPDQH